MLKRHLTIAQMFYWDMAGILKQEEFNTRIEGQKLESTRRSVERSVLEREEARIKAETAKIKGGSREVKVCPSCGGATRGDYCEYCGRKL